MIIMLTDKENDIKDKLKWRFRRYKPEVYDTGLNPEMLDLLVDCYLKNEFNNEEEEVKLNGFTKENIGSDRPGL